MKFLVNKNEYRRAFLDITLEYEQKYKLGAIIKAKKDFFSEKYLEAYEILITNILENIKKYLKVIFYAYQKGIKDTSYQDFLPKDISKVITAFWKKENIPKEKFDTYELILKEIVLYDNDSLLQEFLNMIKDAELINKFSVAIILIDSQKWAFAQNILKDIIGKKEFVNDGIGEIFYLYGKACFYQNEKKEAKKYFLLAKNENIMHEEIHSYLKWLEEE